MTARNALLMAAAMGLAACGTTKTVSMAPPTPAPTTVASAPASSEPLVVKSPLVVDDGDTTQASAGYTPHAPKHHSTSTHHASAEPMAPVTEPAPEKPAKPAKPSKAGKTDKTTLADATPPAEPPATTPPSSTTPPSGPSPTDTTTPDTAAEPPAASQPAVTDSSTSISKIKSLFADPEKLMKTQVAGFPVWMISLGVVALLAVLMIGLGGRRKSEEVV